jgi:hypothetical protein
VVEVNGLEKTFDIDFLDLYIEVLNGLGKLTQVKLTVAIIIKDFELPCKTYDSSATSIL